MNGAAAVYRERRRSPSTEESRESTPSSNRSTPLTRRMFSRESTPRTRRQRSETRSRSRSRQRSRRRDSRSRSHSRESSVNSEKMERRATENATSYMNKTFGTSMSKLLKDIGDRRPNNPIDYLATQLDRMDTEEERSKQQAKSQPKSSIGNESERRDSIDSLDQEYLNLAKARQEQFSSKDRKEKSFV